LPVGGLIFPSIDKKAHDCSTTGFLQAVLTVSQPARDGYCGSMRIHFICAWKKKIENYISELDVLARNM